MYFQKYRFIFMQTIKIYYENNPYLKGELNSS
jgi:hypothetical protein